MCLGRQDRRARAPYATDRARFPYRNIYYIRKYSVSFDTRSYKNAVTCIKNKIKKKNNDDIKIFTRLDERFCRVPSSKGSPEQEAVRGKIIPGAGRRMREGDSHGNYTTAKTTR